MIDQEKYNLLKEAEETSKKNMETPQKKKRKWGCLITILIVSGLIMIFYTFIIYYRHRLFIDLGL